MVATYKPWMWGMLSMLIGATILWMFGSFYAAHRVYQLTLQDYLYLMFFGGGGGAIVHGLVCIVLSDREQGLAFARRGTPPRRNGTEIFPAEWILRISVSLPQADLPRNNFSLFHSRVNHLALLVATAERYFKNGNYIIARDGSMTMLNKKELERLLGQVSGITQILARMELNELPYVDTIKRRLDHDRPDTPEEKAENCVLLRVRMHGEGRSKYGDPFPCAPVFASRDGKVIVQSF